MNKKHTQTKSKKSKRMSSKKLNIIAAVVMLTLITGTTVYSTFVAFDAWADSIWDYDRDGLSNKYENTHTYTDGVSSKISTDATGNKTSPNSSDTDGDTIKDKQEIKDKTDPTVNLTDTDGDGVTDQDENTAGTDSNDANSK